MVRHLEHVGPHVGPHVAGGEEGLGVLLDVAREQEPPPAHPEAHDEALLVDRVLAARGPGERVEELEPGRRLQLDALPDQQRGEGGLVRAGQARDDHGAHVERREHGAQPAHVVGVRVGDEHTVEATHAAASQRVQQRVAGRPAVHEPPRAVRPLDEGGVALADGEEGDGEVAGPLAQAEREPDDREQRDDVAAQERGERERERAEGTDGGVPGGAVDPAEAGEPDARGEVRDA